jgi:hypothetical protein
VQRAGTEITSLKSAQFTLQNIFKRLSTALEELKEFAYLYLLGAALEQVLLNDLSICQHVKNL